MRTIRYTLKARSSITQIAKYLLAQTTSKSFVRQHLDKLRQSVKELLTSFPDSGIQIKLEGISCRRVVVQGVLCALCAAKKRSSHSSYLQTKRTKIKLI